MAQPSQPSFIDLRLAGLYTNPSAFGGNTPAGALSIADNVVLDRPGVVATRRGMDNAFSVFSGTGLESLFQFNNIMLAHGSDNKLYADAAGNGTFTAYSGTYLAPEPSDGASKIRYVESNRNFYFITENGTYRLDHIAGEPRLAGAPAGLSGSGLTTGITGFLPNNTNVAYRVVFGYKDYNETLVLGAPSSRWVVSNTSGTTANTSVTFQVPKEIQAAPTDYIYQLYRGNASPDLATQPDDEMALVFSDVCTGSATITQADITPDSLKGPALYTNTGQEGILQSNFRPPHATDICLFKQFTFYSNTRTVQNANLTLIAAGATNGADALVPGDTVTFAATEFGGPSFILTAVTGSNNAALGWFQVSNTGNPGLDIQRTASNLALVMNGFASNTFLAGYYTSTDTDLPGQMRFDRLTMTSDTFTITSSRDTCWEQTFPITSVNDARANRIYYSKLSQPEAVPVVNYIEVGSANQPINRIVPLRDGVMVLKQDGVFRISNAAPPFTITPIDFNVRILAPNTAAELDNKVYFLSDQGVVALSDSDAQIMSYVLDRTIIQGTSPVLYPNLRDVAWGIAYQSDRKYILFLPQTAGDTQAGREFVYNHLNEVWTRWTLSADCGIILRKDGKMYLGSEEGSAPGTNNSYLYQERKSFTNADYADNQYTTNNTTVGSTNTIVIANPSLPSGIVLLPGWTITQTVNGAQCRIVSTSVGPSFTTIVTDRIQNWTAGNVIIYTPIYTEVETIPIDCQNPGMNKQFSEIIYVFSEQSFTSLTSRISSDTAGIPIADILVPQHRGGWGIDPWGITPWGGSPAGQGKIRRYVPQKVQRAGWIYVNITSAEAFTSFGWSGMQIYFKNTSSRQK